MASGFNPATAYASDWQLMDFIQVADYQPTNLDLVDTDTGWRQQIKGLQLKSGDITSPDFLNIAAAFGITSQGQIFTAWNPTDADFAPRSNDQLTLDDGTVWVVISAIASQFGRWTLPCEPAKKNTPL